MSARHRIERWTPPRECCDPAWEAAYARFETPEAEIQKFLRRLRRFGVERWRRDLRVVEIFCGRGGGLEAWRRLGFHQLEGVDISENLLNLYKGDAQLYVGDCRRLELPDASRDVVCVQGGLHHLQHLPHDLNAMVAEVWRVLRPGGRFLVVEPWSTPFLSLVHWCCGRTAFRKLAPKLDALACMIEHERDTYFNWLSRPGEIMSALTGSFRSEQRHVARGKLSWLGRKPAAGRAAPMEPREKMQAPAENETGRERIEPR